MKKFSDRINADWYTVDVLEKLLNEFFEDELEPKTMTHLYCWLNIDWFEYLERELNPKFTQLLVAAKNECEKWAVEHMVENDKSAGHKILIEKHGWGSKHQAKMGTGDSNSSAEIIIRIED